MCMHVARNGRRFPSCVTGISVVARSGVDRRHQLDDRVIAASRLPVGSSAECSMVDCRRRRARSPPDCCSPPGCHRVSGAGGNRADRSTTSAHRQRQRSGRPVPAAASRFRARSGQQQLERLKTKPSNCPQHGAGILIEYPAHRDGRNSADPARRAGRTAWTCRSRAPTMKPRGFPGGDGNEISCLE